ncbi:EF-P beta-lysylation protein EpmB [Marinicella litoralis]|uniref:L-lysine 2,3-aminomutase n=1 Tax=Marinicella litoralis TaxID=644220 RepID=A0A4R6XN11_9GAMM|nr:EF-P beta-lysylation protein EpmB [Marinicella litoralis]TDR19510.1 L-lysine 2,3-aminomutase [Marinicella litoralis]
MTKTWQDSLKTALKGNNQNAMRAHADFSPQAGQLFAPVVTSSVNKQINWLDDQDPLLLQFLPHVDELTEAADFHSDPVGDHLSTVVPGLIHKYHGRVLLIASGSCAVNCRYCFRRHFPYGQSYAPRNHWQAAIEYIKQHQEIHEVILSGGDPLTLSDKTLKSLTDQLLTIQQVKTLRIHSRIPTVLPTRIGNSFAIWSESFGLNKVMVLHVNHSNELSNDAIKAIQKLKSLGFTLLNQSVLLKNVNDSAAVLIELSHHLFKHGVLPYYLHLFDKVQNASHFDLPESHAIEIYQQMKKHLPGYLLPRLVREEAGEPSKSLINIK